MSENKTFNKNIDLLVDLSEEMLPHSPYEAYFFLKLAQSVRPNGPRIRKLLATIALETKRNWIVALRHDGLSERLITILVGYFTAKSLELDFKFVWPNNEFLESFFNSNSNWHDVPDDCRIVLSSNFVEEYLVGESDFLHPQGEFSFNRRTAERVTVTSFAMFESQQELIRPCWLASNRSFPDLDEAFSYHQMRDFFLNVLLADDLKRQLQSMPPTLLPELRIALHVRGGDIIYGETRFAHSFSMLKSITVALAEKICDDYTKRGYTVIVFGASTKDLDYLSDKFQDVIQLSQLDTANTTGFSKLLRDILVMSECEEIVSSEDTAVTKLASLIGAASFVALSDIFDNSKQYAIHMEYLTEPAFECAHPLQRAFTYWSLFVTSPEDVSYQTRLKHIQCACNNDAQNARYFVYAYFLNLVVGNFEEAERLVETISDLLEEPAACFFEGGKLGQLGITISDDIFLRLLIDADAAPGKPSNATQIVRDLLKKVDTKAIEKF